MAYWALLLAGCPLLPSLIFCPLLLSVHPFTFCNPSPSSVPSSAPSHGSSAHYLNHIVLGPHYVPTLSGLWTPDTATSPSLGSQVGGMGTIGPARTGFPAQNFPVGAGRTQSGWFPSRLIFWPLLSAPSEPLPGAWCPDGKLEGALGRGQPQDLGPPLPPSAQCLSPSVSPCLSVLSSRAEPLASLLAPVWVGPRLLLPAAPHPPHPPHPPLCGPNNKAASTSTYCSCLLGGTVGRGQWCAPGPPLPLPPLITAWMNSSWWEPPPWGQRPLCRKALLSIPQSILKMGH